MQMPVWVGVVLAIIFLTVFSEWFFHTVIGWGVVIVDDVFYQYRIAGATLLSIFIIGSTFMVMAYITECPNEEREGVFERLNCEKYQEIKVGLGINSLPSAKELPLQPEE